MHDSWLHIARKHFQGVKRYSNTYPYFNKTPFQLPDHYDKNNFICQWLLGHHTKREFTPFPARLQ